MDESWLISLWASVWADNSGVGRFMVFLIVTLAGRAAFVGWNQIIRLGTEQAQLRNVIDQLGVLTTGAKSQWDPNGDVPPPLPSKDDGTEDEAPPPPEPVAPGSVDISALRDAASVQSLIHERLEAIETLRRHHVKVNLRTLQGLTAARLASRFDLTAPSRGAHLVMMLGILGTFLGLAAMVQSLQWALPEASAAPALESWRQGLENATAVMSGIKTAFSTSLVGMASAIVLTRLHHRLEVAQATFGERLERFTVEELLPATVPALEDESLLERVSLQMDQSFRRLESVFERNGEIVERLGTVHTSYLDILDGLRKNYRSQDVKTLDELTLGIADTHQSVLQVVKTLPRVAETIESGHTSFLKQLQQERTRQDRRPERSLRELPQALFWVGIPLLSGMFMLACFGLFGLAWAMEWL